MRTPGAAETTGPVGNRKRTRKKNRVKSNESSTGSDVVNHQKTQKGCTKTHARKKQRSGSSDAKTGSRADSP